MGQRFVPDAYVFRELIFRNVGTLEDPRSLPKGLDFFAAMGSERAYQHLDEMGETHFANYPEQMQKMQDWMSGLTVGEWTETLYNTWLYTFDPLIAVPGEGYPEFMQSPAWLDKQLNTVLGSWSELKHDTILYAQSALPVAPPPPPEPPKGAEPVMMCPPGGADRHDARVSTAAVAQRVDAPARLAGGSRSLQTMAKLRGNRLL
jgi:hypothetical protein